MVDMMCNSLDEAIRIKEEVDRFLISRHSEHFDYIRGIVKSTYLYSNDICKDKHMEALFKDGWCIEDTQEVALFPRNDLKVIVGTYNKEIEKSIAI